MNLFQRATRSCFRKPVKSLLLLLSLLEFQSLSPGATIARVMRFQSVPLLKSSDGYGISTVCASTTPLGLALASGSPRADEPSPRNLRFSAIMILT